MAEGGMAGSKRGHVGASVFISVFCVVIKFITRIECFHVAITMVCLNHDCRQTCQMVRQNPDDPDVILTVSTTVRALNQYVLGWWILMQILATKEVNQSCSYILDCFERMVSRNTQIRRKTIGCRTVK